MVPDAFQAVLSAIQSAWILMTSIYIPGTNITPASFFLGIFVIYNIWRTLLIILGGAAIDNSKEASGRWLGSRLLHGGLRRD